MNSTLIFSSIGYLPQEQLVDGRPTIDVTLVEDSRQLTDVVVVGYGTRQKKDVTGAVSSVRAAELQQENPTSITDQIRGNVPGISVSMNTSAKGGGTGDLLVRGKTTLTANTSPLIVLDGVIYYGQLSDINPNDIQTIDVLKDASALAVYGSKAATGVIAVTTKRGKTGKPQISLNTNWGIAELSKYQAVYGPQGFLKWRADVMRSTNVNNPYYMYTDPRQLPDSVSLETWQGTATGDPVDIWL
ncbi:MAG TPA: TonB-dependent receptor plug domain-containing protein, partial [Chitinophaga sp.]